MARWSAHLRIALQLTTSTSESATPQTFNWLGHVIVDNKRHIPGETIKQISKTQQQTRTEKKQDDYHVLDINTTARHVSRYQNIFSTRLETRQSKLSVKLRRNKNKSTDYTLFSQILTIHLKRYWVISKKLTICITGLFTSAPGFVHHARSLRGTKENIIQNVSVTIICKQRTMRIGKNLRPFSPRILPARLLPKIID